jgi:hypothetical protein
MNALSLALLLALGVVGAPRDARPPGGAAADAATTADLTDAQVAGLVRSYLGAIDRPVSEERWRALGPRAVSALEAVVRDPQALPSRRGKALGALSIVGGERARSVLLETVRSEREPFNVRASAMRGAARLVPARTLDAELRPLLRGARDPMVRAVAAEVLAEEAPASSCEAVAAQAARETPARRGHFSRALEACAEAGAAR